MTAYCYDTEFLEDGQTIELISIGIVCDDGREYYAVNAELPIERIRDDDWLLRNVVPYLPVTNRRTLDHYINFPVNVRPRPTPTLVDVDRTATCVKPRWVIANEVRDFLVGDLTPAGQRDGKPFYSHEELPELWADYAAYDHVVLAQLWGKMIHLPTGIPMFTNDIEQAIRTTPGFVKPKQVDGEHNALTDARHVADVLAALRHHRLTAEGTTRNV